MVDRTGSYSCKFQTKMEDLEGIQLAPSLSPDFSCLKSGDCLLYKTCAFMSGYSLWATAIWTYGQILIVSFNRIYLAAS